MKVSFFKSVGLMLFFLLLTTVDVQAQCAMCRAALESEESGVQAASVNNGIVYLMIFPYLLAGVGGYFIYKVYIKKKQNKSIEENRL